MKAKVIVTAAMLVVGGMASAQEDSKYYMNVETAPDKVQSYEVNPDLKVSWEPTRKGANPSGYYTKDEVDKMLRRIDEELQVNHYTLDNHQSTLENICNLLVHSSYLLKEDVEHYKKEYFPLGVLEFIKEKHTTPVKARDDSSMELMEENKVLKDNVEDMQKEIEKLKKEKEDLSKQMNDLMGRIEALEKK